jgi:hypothetical protein
MYMGTTVRMIPQPTPAKNLPAIIIPALTAAHCSTPPMMAIHHHWLVCFFQDISATPRAHTYHCTAADGPSSTELVGRVPCAKGSDCLADIVERYDGTCSG